MSDSIRVYLAGPLFTQAEWQWNERLAQQLADRGIEVILPQRRAEPMLSGAEPFDPLVLFRANLESIERASALVAILDGADPDSGTCWECGYAYKLGRPIIGLRTDIRAGGDDPRASVNLMLSMACASLVIVPPSKRNDLLWIAEAVSSAIRATVGRVR